MILGLDYAGGRPGGNAIMACGYQFVVRYLSDGGPGLPGKLLTAAEYTDLQRAGVAVCCNWETSATRMLGGYAAGASDAQSAAAVCGSLGHPMDRPIYFSADWDASPAQQTAIDAYLDGAASKLGGPARVGVYGGYWVVKRCLDNGKARWGWQTGAWSGGNVDPRIHLYQRIGYVDVNRVQCDVNEARQLDFGQTLLSAPPIPAPGAGPESIPLMEYGQTSPPIKHAQLWFNENFQAYSHINPISGYYGDQTTAVVREFQARAGIRGGDGRNVGPQTRTAMYQHGFRG
jgi:hypothetical protein